MYLPSRAESIVAKANHRRSRKKHGVITRVSTRREFRLPTGEMSTRSPERHRTSALRGRAKRWRGLLIVGCVGLAASGLLLFFFGPTSLTLAAASLSAAVALFGAALWRRHVVACRQLESEAVDLLSDLGDSPADR